MEIVLASASKRRQELLEKIGLQFSVDPSDYPEDGFFELKPRERAKQVSLEKARAVAARHRDALIIAADTFIVARGKVMGKPHSSNEAKRMLKALSGRSHTVITGFTIMDTANNKTLSRAVETKIHMRKLSEREIGSYVSSGEPLDKAGAYAIQGLGSVLIDRIEGDYYNVVGLPLSAFTKELKRFGVKVL
jgi:septum formation protein